MDNINASTAYCSTKTTTRVLPTTLGYNPLFNFQAQVWLSLLVPNRRGSLFKCQPTLEVTSSVADTAEVVLLILLLPAAPGRVWAAGTGPSQLRLLLLLVPETRPCHCRWKKWNQGAP